MRNWIYPNVSCYWPLWDLFREVWFLNRKGNKKFIIGRINQENSLEDVIKNFLNNKIPINYDFQDERFMDSFDHVLTSLVNQAEKDEKFSYLSKMDLLKEG